MRDASGYWARSLVAKHTPDKGEITGSIPSRAHCLTPYCIGSTVASVVFNENKQSCAVTLFEGNLP